ncbi:MAG: ABC transporter permease [Planctomycetota bacterium]
MRGSTLFRTVRLGISSLLLHKLRSALTMLGVLFGVSSVIAMLAVGEGASEQAQEQIRKLGSRNIILRSVKPPDDGNNDAEVRVAEYGLTRDDHARIEGSFPGVRRAVPVLQSPVEVRESDLICLPRVLSTLPEYQEVTRRELYDGRFLTPLDDETRALVCVLGYEVARYLFPFQSALGQRVKLGEDYFDVVGVMYPRGPIGSISSDFNSETGGEVFVPLATGRAYFGERQTIIRGGTMDSQEVQLHEIVVEAERDEDVAFIADACREMLRRGHNQKDYEVIVPLELLMRAEETKKIFNQLLGSIAGISLLVGGIGIMNVMLATVTERTREIGVRRALGAQKRHIVTQFLVETIVLSSTGGLLGVLVGIASPWVISQVSENPTPAIVTPFAPILAFSISVAIGVIFGLYPAWRAAAMDPVEALRHE